MSRKSESICTNFILLSRIPCWWSFWRIWFFYVHHYHHHHFCSYTASIAHHSPDWFQNQSIPSTESFTLVITLYHPVPCIKPWDYHMLWIHLGSHLPSGVYHSSEMFFCCVGVGFCTMSESGSSCVNDVTVYDVSGTHHRQIQTSYLLTIQSPGFWFVPLWTVDIYHVF
jgi:hypothetical protein